MGNNLRWTREDVAASKVAKDPRNVAALAEIQGRKPATVAPQSVLTPKTPQDTHPKAKKRLRQGEKPLMNKLEAMWYLEIRHKFPSCPPIRVQAKRYQLGNGVTFTPDFSCSSWPELNPKETAWEVKGAHSWDDSLVKIKLAAELWPEVRWFFVWRDANGIWATQEVVPLTERIKE
jgi:hypothetical protein